jgi:hypothetical protein
MAEDRKAKGPWLRRGLQVERRIIKMGRVINLIIKNINLSFNQIKKNITIVCACSQDYGRGS